MEVKIIRIEIRKHHVTPGLNVLDLEVDADGEKIIRQTQHKDSDQSYQKFVKEAVRIAKELADARIE
jgi:hypothetical protein